MTLRINAEHGAPWWGRRGGPGAGWALDALPALLGTEDEPAAYTAQHRIVAEVVRRHPGRLNREPLSCDEARRALTDGGIRACEICRPDSELGILD
ncbi:DUF6233 domain-containing protein [Streptomyces sp. NPDC056463]|uniref:DUF6233 domain-containing protein n=1 Tax=unclassified Streptomyces TaxID=2593676 RepID=UPI0036A808D0